MKTDDRYRLTSDDEPTDEQLEQIMREVGEDARKKNNRIQEELREIIRKELASAQSRFAWLRQ